MAAKTLLYTAADETLAPINTYSGENRATKLVVDFSNCGVDTYAKWIRFSNSEPILLGTAISVEYEIPVAFMARGRLEVQPYAIGPDGQVVKFAIRAIPVNRSLEESDENTYDPTDLESIQTAVSDAVIQVGAIWEAYNTGELDGEDGLDGTNGVDGVDGAKIISASFVGNDIVFGLDDASTVSLVGAKNTLKGEIGATGLTGATGATVTSVAFVGNDIVFTKSDATTVTLAGAKLALKGDQGIQGLKGDKGDKGDTGEQGLKGDQGIQGIKGDKGDKGDTGSIEDLGGVIAGLAPKTTPVEADSLVISDSESANIEKKLSWTNIKAALKTYFDTLYNNYVHPANHPASIITQDSSNRFVTDTEKITWNSKANGTHSHLTSDVTGLDTALAGKVDSTRVLTDVPAGAVFTDTVYTHPANHAPSIITQDASNRFVTDDEKADWNAKAPLASPALVTPTVSGSGRIISNDTATGTAIYEIWSGTQAQYDAIGTKDANTLYFIV